MGRQHRLESGFTLFETFLVIMALGVVSVGILRLQSNVFLAQSISRDEVAGVELQRACAERLLSVRRVSGFAAPQSSNSTSTPTCNGLGGVGGFDANPTVSMTDANGAAVTACTGTVCNISIAVAKTSAPAATLPPMVLQLSAY